MMQRKWPARVPVAYFQAYTNIYTPLPVLKATSDPFAQHGDIAAISIATRADCLENDKIAYLRSLCTDKEIQAGLGLQSIHDGTVQHIGRGHTYARFLDYAERLPHTGSKVTVHLMSSLPGENKLQMLKTAVALAGLPMYAVKIHILHIMEDTCMAQECRQSPFVVLSRREYIDIIIRQLELLPAEMIIQQLTGDGVKKALITPLWTLKKVATLNDINKEMK